MSRVAKAVVALALVAGLLYYLQNRVSEQPLTQIKVPVPDNELR